MKIKLSDDQSSCITTQGKHTGSSQQYDESMKTAWRFLDTPYDLVLNVCFVNFTGRRVQ